MEFCEKNYLNSLIFRLTRETDAQKKLSNFAKLQFLNLQLYVQNKIEKDKKIRQKNSSKISYTIDIHAIKTKRNSTIQELMFCKLLSFWLFIFVSICSR
jgi:hypothetical protein